MRLGRVKGRELTKVPWVEVVVEQGGQLKVRQLDAAKVVMEQGGGGKAEGDTGVGNEFRESEVCG